jgi:hypothetical protein
MDELASLQESAREIALERFRSIQPCLEEDRSVSVMLQSQHESPEVRRICFSIRPTFFVGSNG